MRRTRLSRRTLLRGVGLSGIALGLPTLDAMLGPRAVLMGEARAAAPSLKRLVLFHFPNGAHMEDWIPTSEGTGYTLPAELSALSDLKADFNLVSGLSNLAKTTKVDGLDGGHNNANLSFLTGTAGASDGGASSISVDQLAAQHIGGQTKLSSLFAALFHYGDTRNSRMCWAGQGQPVIPDTEPSAVFDRLFGDGQLDPGQAAKLSARRQSILDFVKADITDLELSLGSSDKVRLEQHLDSVRQLEKSIQALNGVSCSIPTQPGALGDDQLQERADALVDLTAMALTCDLTRVVCLSMGNTNNTKTYPFIGVPYKDHEVSHYRAITQDDEPDSALRKQKNDELYRKMTAWKIGQFARLLKRMKETPEGDGTLLDNSVVVCASEMSNGDWHSAHNLPVIVAGGGMPTGKHIRFPCDPGQAPTGKWCLDQGGANTPLANLWLTVLQAVGVDVSQFGESDKTLSGLWV